MLTHADNEVIVCVVPDGKRASLKGIDANVPAEAVAAF
jgi:hypothetical protein